MRREWPLLVDVVYWLRPARSSKDQDFTTVAKRAVQQAIGEQSGGIALPEANKGKNPAAVALGKVGGAKGARRGRLRSARTTGTRSPRRSRGRGGDKGPLSGSPTVYLAPLCHVIGEV